MFIGVAVLLVILFLCPIYLRVGNLYNYYVENTVSIVIFILFIRYIFLFSSSVFSRNNAFRFIMILLSIALFMYQIDNLFDFL